MNNEEKMLQILAQMQSNIENLDTDMQDVKQKVTKIEVTLENETNHNIRLLAEGHEMMVEKLTKRQKKWVAKKEQMRKKR